MSIPSNKTSLTRTQPYFPSVKTKQKSKIRRHDKWPKKRSVIDIITQLPTPLSLEMPRTVSLISRGLCRFPRRHPPRLPLQDSSVVMSVTGEEAIQPSSDSFWEIGKYKRTVKRAEDGFRLSEDLIAMVQERIAIEKKYAKSLKVWSQKWAQHVEKVR